MSPSCLVTDTSQSPRAHDLAATAPLVHSQEQISAIECRTKIEGWIERNIQDGEQQVLVAPFTKIRLNRNHLARDLWLAERIPNRRTRGYTPCDSRHDAARQAASE